MTQASVLFTAVSTFDEQGTQETTQDNSKLQETSKTPTATSKNFPAS